MTQISTEQVQRRDAPVTCDACGRRVARKSRQQKFCSDRCRQFASRENKARTAIKNPVCKGQNEPPSYYKGKLYARKKQNPVPPVRYTPYHPSGTLAVQENLNGWEGVYHPSMTYSSR